MRSGGSISGTHSDGLGLSLCLHDKLQAARKERDCKLFNCLKFFLIFNFVLLDAVHVLDAYHAPVLTAEPQPASPVGISLLLQAS